MSEQFYSGYNELSDYINLELLPIVSVEGTGIKCAHGDNECFISEAQGCVFERPGLTEALRMDYLFCTEKAAAWGLITVDADIEECVNTTLKGLVSYETVKTCMDNDESIPILAEYRARVDALGVEWVPWLALFQSYDEDVETSLRSNFVKEICSRLSNPPAVCSDSKRTYL
jgi:hypothetical protein